MEKWSCVSILGNSTQFGPFGPILTHFLVQMGKILSFRDNILTFDVRIRLRARDCVKKWSCLPLKEILLDICLLDQFLAKVLDQMGQLKSSKDSIWTFNVRFTVLKSCLVCHSRQFYLILAFWTNFGPIFGSYGPNLAF